MCCNTMNLKTIPNRRSLGPQTTSHPITVSAWALQRRKIYKDEKQIVAVWQDAGSQGEAAQGGFGDDGNIVTLD